MNWRVPLYKIYSDEADKEAVTRVIERGMSWANGAEIIQFEDKLASYSGRKYALTFNNGTSALHAMLLAYGIGVGDEVIVPSFTFISTCNSVLFTGAKPVFADIEDETYALDPDSVNQKITDKTKAILPMHYAGCPAKKINQLKELCEDKGILLLEDAAEALGASLDGKKVGTFGSTAMFSFCANKVITSGEGGALVTDSEEIYQKLKLLRSHGRLETENYFDSTAYMDYVALGYNFRMPTMVAALALAQLNKIEKIISMRRDVAEIYKSKLAGGSLKFLPDGNGVFNVYQMFTVLLQGKEQRDGLQKHLEEKGIMSRVYFDPVNKTHFYKKVLEYSEESLPITEEVSERVLSLPIFPHMPKEDINYVCENILDYLR